MKIKNDKICSINDPNGLTNEMIQHLGRVYLRKHPGGSGACFKLFDLKAHTNQPVALLLQNYAEQSMVYEKWMFLATCYKGLQKSNGELSRAIKALFMAAFGQPIAAYFCIRHAGLNESVSPDVLPSTELVSQALKSMVSSYYVDQFRKEAASYSATNTFTDLIDRGVALWGRQLRSAQGFAFESAYDNWLALAAAPNPNKELLSDFEQLFGKTVCVDHADASQVSVALTAIVKEYYANQYKLFAEQQVEVDSTCAVSLSR